MSELRVALVGATGMVGRNMLDVLNERDFPVSELIPVASARSAGKTISFRGKDYTVCTPEQALEKKPHLALFSAGGSVSKKWAPQFTAAGCYVVDNSSAWRMDTNTPLIVPEINAETLKPNHLLIANPNCSTIQMLMALAPIHKHYGIKRLVVATYQSVTGTGYEAVQQMDAERAGTAGTQVYPHRIDKNTLPHCDVFLDNGYTKEEMKMVNETRKILQAPDMAITATAVRVPVVGGHSEAVNLELEHAFTLDDIRNYLSAMPGVIVQDNPAANEYPMPLHAHGKDEVFVGRIRKDESIQNGLNLWVVADNLRKGAATNTIQIAEYLLEKNWLAVN